MEVLLVAVLCITTLVAPPASVFALHHRFHTPRNRKMTHWRIVLYSFALYLLIGAFSTAVSTFSGELSYIERACREPYDCNNIIVAGHAELWLRMALYPISQDKCFTRNNFACHFIDREVMGLWSNGDAFEEDKGIAIFAYYILAVIFAIPPLIMYALLRKFYLKPTKQKRANS